MTKPRSKTADERTMVAIRLSRSQLDEITERARELKLTRTDYMIRVALGQPLATNVTTDLEQRVRALEEQVFRIGP